MAKGFIFDLIKLDNGFLLTIFRLFKIGTIHDNEGYGKYYTLLLGIKKLEFTLSLTWRTALNGNEKGQEIQKQHKRKKSQTPTASA